MIKKENSEKILKLKEYCEKIKNDNIDRRKLYLPLRTKEYRESLRRITGVVAQDIMTTPVNTISPDASVEDAATVMVSNRSNPLPVVDESGKMIGIISRTDILRVFEDLELQLEEELQEGEEAAGPAA